MKPTQTPQHPLAEHPHRQNQLRQNQLLCILDGWGWGDAGEHNAIFKARTPNWDMLWQRCPMRLLEASGVDVGLPKGQMGNSEVGHMTIGAGRPIKQLLEIINLTIAKSDRLEELILKAFKNSDPHALGERLKNAGAVHLMGLVSDGGVHGHINHAVHLARVFVKRGFRVFLHAFLDGRDSPMGESERYLKAFSDAVPEVKIASLSGRFWAMDRDSNWDRTKKALEAINARALAFNDWEQALKHLRSGGLSDEFFTPCILGDYQGIKQGDHVVCFNFRPDRVRQILTALSDPACELFDPLYQKLGARLGMVRYSDKLSQYFSALFEMERPNYTLGSIVADAGLNQLRIGETEKQAHVTYFLNGGREHAFDNEDRTIIPSPAVKTYDMAPEMSAHALCDQLVDHLRARSYDLIVANFANADMVGHTGNFEASVRAVEVLDQCLGRLIEALDEAKAGHMLLTADHGNIETMFDVKTKAVITAHSCCPVPAILYRANMGGGLKGCIDVNSFELFERDCQKNSDQMGGLCDIAPTMLDLMGLQIPQQMTGQALFRQK
ncbi:MAG: 2,3-bisphosphoglycerate-independent phosphoglycerate mutase [Pseudomonadota bacterium]